MTFAVGSLVRARGREWVVLPSTDEEVIMVRPLGGSDDEVTGIHTLLEEVVPASFDLPDPNQVGDARSARLLRDAVRLGFRNSAGPFRSFARLAVEPRPYQLVPLLMGLKLDPIRLLIADDVGIGKTVEAGLIAREMIDRGEIQRLAVVCPPHLAEQWQTELSSKFHIDAELVLSSTASRLERNLQLHESIFDIYPYVIVSIDYIKSEKRRAEFIRTCPEFVIVDEAHTCASGAQGSGKQQRHEVVKKLAEAPDRHMVLVTATPHSGNEQAFRSLLELLSAEFSEMPEDLGGPENELNRRKLAQHFIQRRRVDIRDYLDENTPFPEREEREETYKLSPEYKTLFERILDYARESVKDTSGDEFRQRVRWWSALSLLRSMASSPAAAAATLRSRAAAASAETAEEVNEIGRRMVLDAEDVVGLDGQDVIPGSDISELEDNQVATHRRLLDMARAADALKGKPDAKLQKAIDICRELLRDGFRPIVFCRFIPTADYLAEQLRSVLKDVEVVSVTGILPPAERKERVLQLSKTEKRILVATDCLSEGINLQQYFDAVVHYDLSWNPTRHEQREGRVDRFGQMRDKVPVITYYGIDNKIDGLVLDVLLRKHKTIRDSLGISVPVPIETDQIVEAIFEGLLLREQSGGVMENYLPGLEEYMKPKKEMLYREWDNARDKEKRSRTMFAQTLIKVDEVTRELHAAKEAVALGVDVQAFTLSALQAHKAVVSQNGSISVNMTETSRALRDLIGMDKFKARFYLPVESDELYLSRTHPLVEQLAAYTLSTALDGHPDSAAKRCGVIRTTKVNIRTTFMLFRLRHHVITIHKNGELPLLAEEAFSLAFRGNPKQPEWLTQEETEALLVAQPDANIQPQQASQFVKSVLDEFGTLQFNVEHAARQRSEALLEAHRRVRSEANQRGIRYRVEPNLPADLLGIFVFLPAQVG